MANLNLKKKTTVTRKARVFSGKMQKKLVVLFLMVLLAFVGLTVRLIRINTENGDQYKKKVLSQLEYDSLTLPYRRGSIVDTNGTTLAVSQKVYNLIVDSKIILTDDNYLEPTVEALAECFGLDAGKMRSYILEHPTSSYYRVLKQLSYDEISAFLELQNDSRNHPNIKGVWFEEEYKRVYPYGKLACHALGFTTGDGVGMYGLEQYYNDVLTGMNGREYGYLNDDSTLERTTVAATDGMTIRTTIDVNIQNIAEKYLLEFNEEHKDEYREGEGSYHSAAIVMNPNTGEILGMAVYPNFDLSDPYNLSGYYTQEELDAMDTDTYYDLLNQLWTNFCISSTYEPGSTAKPFTIAEALEVGKIRGNEHYTCSGGLQVADYYIKCNNRYGHGDVSVSGALEQSCNVALMLIAQQLGKDEFLNFQDSFNFGRKTNIDLAGETATTALVYNQSSMGPTELATSSFGQGYNVTMIQMASAFCSLINGGYYYEPHMVNAILTPEGHVAQEIAPRVLKQTISNTTSARMVEYLNSVTTVGTGKSARPAGYLIGGKTGTAETAGRDKKNYVVSFIGYAPANDPQVMVYVVIDRPNVKDQPHAYYAGGVVRKILTEILPYLNIYKTEDMTDAEREELVNLGLIWTEDGKVMDPETGFLYDLNLGQYVDPVTGEPVDTTGQTIVEPEE